MDSVTHDALMLEYVLKLQGSKRITLGTDYPFPLGDLEIGRFIDEMNLEKSVVENIFHGAALEWLNVPRQRFE